MIIERLYVAFAHTWAHPQPQRVAYHTTLEPVLAAARAVSDAYPNKHVYVIDNTTGEAIWDDGRTVDPPAGIEQLSPTSYRIVR
jgi:hypothetical protein